MTSEGYIDAAIFPVTNSKMAFTTDSFVVKPLFFKGGDIGRLEQCRDARIIGTFIEDTEGIVYMENIFGGERILNMLEGEMLPRIC